MKTTLYGIALAWTVAFWAGFASAETYTLNGTITGVEEIYTNRTVQHPQQTCTIVDVPVYGKTQGGTTGDVLTGAIIGGIIGNNIKGENGGGAAGAVLGGILGAEKGSKETIVGYRQQQQCETTYTSHTDTVLAGYKISYEVLGMSGMVNRSTGTRPVVGSTIPVTVHINAR